MKIISWNVNGIRAVAKKGFVDWFAKRQPEILCLQETRALLEQFPDGTNPLPKTELHLNVAEKKGYSGVADYTSISPMNIVRGMGIEEFDREGRVIQLEFENFFLLNVYFPNGKKDAERLDYKMRFYEAYLKHVLKLEKLKPVITCGDFNTAHKEIDLARPKSNEKESGFLPIERDWIDRFIASGQIDAFREFHTEAEQYTWWSQRGGARSRNVGWRIDYFFLSKSLRPHLKDAFILPNDLGSDHCPLGIELDFK